MLYMLYSVTFEICGLVIGIEHYSLSEARGWNQLDNPLSPKFALPGLRVDHFFIFTCVGHAKVIPHSAKTTCELHVVRVVYMNYGNGWRICCIYIYTNISLKLYIYTLFASSLHQTETLPENWVNMKNLMRP
jgi:hypothetical protein